MTNPTIDAIDRLIAALTYDHIEHIDRESGDTIAEGEGVPLLQRSIAQDLRQIEGRLGVHAKGRTILGATADAIDEALLAAAEAKAELAGGGA